MLWSILLRLAHESLDTSTDKKNEDSNPKARRMLLRSEMLYGEAQINRE